MIRVSEDDILPEPLYVLVQFVLLFIDVLSFAMLIRALLSWFTDESSKLCRFLYVLTEPAIMPIRKLLVKMNWFQDSPIDFSFLFTFFALTVVELLIGALTGGI